MEHVQRRLMQTGLQYRERDQFGIGLEPRFESGRTTIRASRARNAAIHGTAAGGGCELALSCDFRVMESGGRIGLPETSLAIVPGAGGTQRLPRLIGVSRAKHWIFSGRLFTAEEALADGVADRVAGRDELLAVAHDMVIEAASAAPLAIRAAKAALDAALGLPLEEGLALEWEAYESILGTEDRLEALAAFREKRKPVFKGR